MHIFVKDLESSKTINLEVESSDTIAAIKQKIQDQIHIPINRQCFMFENKPIMGNGTLLSYNIRQGSTLYVTNCGNNLISVEPTGFTVNPMNFNEILTTFGAYLQKK
jgi:ubiquitin-large subunit ribosomal protein L40e